MSRKVNIQRPFLSEFLQHAAGVGRYLHLSTTFITLSPNLVPQKDIGMCNKLASTPM